MSTVLCGTCCCADTVDDDVYRHFEDTGSSKSAQNGPPAKLDDFEALAVLGRGSYGKVFQVRHRETGELYAMKAMRKAEIATRNQARHTLTERALLQAVRHPFIVRLHFAFQCDNCLYLVLALQSGGELFFHLRREGAFAEARVRLYAAEIFLALQAIHTAGFIYRDLKPENVLLDTVGHVRLSDFGLAKEITCAPATTFCGTPSYMAPEVLLATGHGVAVDWWSFGTLTYEMLAGCPPFYSRNLHAMYRAILVGEVHWPVSIRRSARALIEGLLTRDPLRRLGASSARQVQRHPFFRKLDFRRVLSCGYKPSYAPTLSGASASAHTSDTTNFDVQFTAEDPHQELLGVQGHTGTGGEAGTCGSHAAATGLHDGHPSPEVTQDQAELMADLIASWNEYRSEG